MFDTKDLGSMADYPALQAVPKFDALVKHLKLKTTATPLQAQADLLRDMFDDIKTGKKTCTSWLIEKERSMIGDN
jgi:hypothetical protein